MPKKADKPVANEENAAPSIDPQKQYLMDQFGGLMKQVGEGFGGPLQEELIRRLEQTISDFHEEVSEMLTNLKENSEKRQERLKEIWDNPEGAATDDGGDEDEEEFVPGSGRSSDSGGEVSEWEKRLESMDSGGDSGKGAEPAAEEEKPKKKKGLFGLMRK